MHLLLEFKIQFEDGTTKSVSIEIEDDIKNGHYYNEDGTFEGKIDIEKGTGSINDVLNSTNKRNFSI